MRPTFLGFETAKSSVFTNQKALDIVGNNLANVDTEGYSRQRVDRTSVAPSAFSSKVASNRTGLAGMGVDTLGVSQTRDSFIDKCFRDEYSIAAYHGQSADILSAIQSALVDGGDITSDAGLQGAMEKIYSALNDFIKEPTQSSGANVVMSACKNLCQVLNQLDSSLLQVRDQQIGDMEVSVTRTNEILAQIAHLNHTISSDATVVTNPDNEYFRPNELMDQRNLLLDELSGYGNVNIIEKGDGTVTVEMGGHTVVEGDKYSDLSMATDSRGYVSLKWRSSGEDVSLTGGTLLARQEYINGRGRNVQSSSESVKQGIPYYRDRLNTFASSFVQLVNSTIPQYDKETGQPLEIDGQIQYKTLLAARTPDGSLSPDYPISAANITLSSEWQTGGGGYLVYNPDEAVEEYAQQLASTLTDTNFTFKSYGETFEGSFVEYHAEMLGRLGSDLSFEANRQEATSAVADEFVTHRDSISGVSKDEETTDMLKYQKSYEAAARLMTVLDEVLDVIINRMGRVGL